MSTAIVFPGQGSQFIGMGKDLYDNSNYAREVFEEVDDILGRNLSRLMFEGDINELTLTSNAQPAIMAVSIAAFRVFMETVDSYNDSDTGDDSVDVSDICAMTAGHSLGEYSALCAAGAISLHDTVKLLRIRGDAMQNAVSPGIGAMLALLGTENIAKVQELIDNSLKRTYQSSKHHDMENGINYVCQIANDNGAGQLVLSGHTEVIESIMESATRFGIKRAIKLPVSAPFHSALMAPAADIMQETLGSSLLASQSTFVQFHKPIVPVISNYTAELNDDIEVIKVMLVKQMAGMVRWRESMDVMVKNGINTIIEFGPGKVLTTLANRHFPENTIKTYNISTLKDIDDYNNK